MDTITIIHESQPTKKVDISLRQLIDIDETGGVTANTTTAEGNINHNQILTAYAEQIDINGTLGKVKIFRFKNLVSLISGGTGIAVSSTAGNITTITNTGVTSIIAGTGITVSGATGNVTVNSTGGIDRGKRGVQFFTDFDNTATSTPNFTQFQSGAGASVIRQVINLPNVTASQTGFAQFQTGTTATGYITQTNEGWVGAQFFFGGGTWVFETSICVETLSTSLERFRFISGFGNAATNLAESNGTFFTYDEGATQNGTAATPNWQTQTCNASVRTLTTTSVAVTAGAWTKLRIEVNAAASSVAFYINGTLAATHTTNIPKWLAANNPRGFNVKQSIVKTIGTTTRSVFCDYFGYENVLTTPRT